MAPNQHRIETNELTSITDEVFLSPEARLAKELGISLSRLLALGKEARDKYQKNLRTQPSKLFCQACIFTPPVLWENGLLHDHHIIPKEYGGHDGADNLMKLCPTCHRLAHLAIENNLIVWTNPTPDQRRRDTCEAIRKLYSNCKRAKYR